MRSQLGFGLVVAALAVGACGGDDEGTGIKDQNPTGTINGAAWNMVEAIVRDEGSTLDVNLYGEDVEDCGVMPTTTLPYVMFNMPDTVGTRQLQLDLFDLTSGTNQTITFVTPPSSNNISTDGWLDLKALDATSVTLGIIATAGADNLNGTFTVNLCP